MSIKTASVPKDVQELQFKQSSIHQISESFSSVPISCSLVVTDGKRGLLYVGHQNKISVIKLGHEANIEWKIDLDLPDNVSRISLSCDCSYLAVTLSAPAVLIYSAASLYKNFLDLLHEIRLSTSSGDIYVFDLRWNPAVPGMLCTVASDNTIGSFQIKGDRKAGIGIIGLERINGIEALCVAWSPKGKQIVVGCRNGNIIQLKPELKPARTIPGPNPYIGGVMAILWVSNYQFCAAFQEPGEQRVNVLIVDAPKGEALASFTNYEDITYGGVPTTRYYFDHIPEWGIIIAASSTSSEVAVLGSVNNGTSWEQWQLVDSGRAELPLVRTDESFPVGLAIDRSSDKKIPWGPENTLPNPIPLLHILGTSGQLCSFHVVNLKPDCPVICTPPSEIVVAPQVPAAFPTSRPSIASSEISFNLTTGATSTPRSKVETPMEKPKNVMMTNFFAETPKPPDFPPKVQPMNPTPVPLSQIETKNITYASQPEPKPTNFVPQVEIKIPKPRVEKVDPPAKLEVKLPTPREPILQQKPNIDENLCLRAYREEQANFEKELKTRLEPLTWEIGTRSEKEQLVEKTTLIDEFLRDLQETTTSLASDIAYLKGLLLQSFAWLEETKSKNSGIVNLCTRNRRENSKLAELQRFFYYTQSQLVQASKVLDLQWSDQQSKEQKKMKIPNMEFIYQSLMRHGQILSKEKSNIENLTRKWKSLARGGTISGLNRSLSNLQISSITSSNFGNDSAIDSRCKAIATRTQSFSREKQMKLRDLLAESAPKIIKPAKPTLIQDRLEATLTSLASLSPVKVSKPKPEQKSAPTQKSKVQSPLASLNNIVAKIGTPTRKSEPSNESSQVKTSISTSTLAFGMKNIPYLNISPLASQAKPKQPINISFAQSPLNSQNLPKSFPKVDSISFGQKSDEKAFGKSGNEEKEMALFSGKNLSEISTSQGSGTIPGSNAQNSNIQGSSIISSAATQPVQSTFSLQTTVSLPTSTAAHSFSFASKPSTILPAFSFPSKPDEKLNLDLGGLNLSLQSSGLSITPVSESKAASSSQVTPAMLSLNFGKASSSSVIFEQTPSGTNTFGTSSINVFGTSSATSTVNVFGTSSGTSTTNIFGTSSGNSATTPTTLAGSIFGKSGTQTSLFGSTKGSIFGGSSTFGVPSTGVTTSTISSGVSVPSSTGFSISGGVPALSPISVPVSSSIPASKAVPTTSLALASSSAPVLSSNVTTPVSATPVSVPPPAYSSHNVPPISSSSISPGPDLLSLSLGTPKPPTTIATTTVTSSTILPFQTPTTASSIFSTPAFGGVSSTSSTLNFGTAAAISSSTSITPVFGKESTTSPGSIFGGSSTISSGNNAFGGAATSPPTNAFGGNSLNQSPSSTSIFGSASTAPGGSIFGGNTTATGGAFGMKTPPAATGSIFGMSSQAPAFGAPANTSLFGSGMAKPPDSTFSMFGGSALGGGTTSTFGQAPAFGSKPAFGASPDFGQAKPAFGTGFGAPAFGSSSTAAAFGSPPMMGGSPPPLTTGPMQKVFGGSTGSNTFESLATQGGGLSFSSLAQSSPEQQQPQQQKPPEFAAKSSFSSWR